MLKATGAYSYHRESFLRDLFASGLVTQLRTGSRPLLSGPVDIRCSVDGRTVPLGQGTAEPVFARPSSVAFRKKRLHGSLLIDTHIMTE